MNISNHSDALSALRKRPECIDRAIDVLAQAERKSDLAAAYYYRAQLKDHPSDLLRALDVLEQEPRNDAAVLFNRGLTLEALSHFEEAIASYDALARLEPGSDWSREAKQRRARLASEIVRTGAARWDAIHPQLAKADDATLAELIAPFPGDAQSHVEAVLIREWADTGSPKPLALARRIGEVLHRRTGDLYTRDVVAAITNARPEMIPVLREAHKHFAEAREHDRTLKWNEALATYRRARAGFERAGSAARFGAELGMARASSIDKPEAALPLLIDVQQQAEKRHYRMLAATTAGQRGLCNGFLGRYAAALDHYDQAIRVFHDMGEIERATALQYRRAGWRRVAGDHEGAWRDFYLVRDLAPAGSVDMYVKLAETAEAVSTLGHKRAALLYFSQSIDALSRILTRTAPSYERDTIARSLANTYRGRAGLYASIGDLKRATTDLDGARAVAPEATVDDDVVRAGIASVEAEILLRGNRAGQAVAKLSEALELTAAAEYPSARAQLFARRAEAQWKAGDRAASEGDLREALRLLAAEESLMLENRERGEAEALWSRYFSRFLDTYRVLIGMLAADASGRAEAFGYVERSRAYEPLDLLRGTVSPEVRKSIARPLGLAEIRRELPQGTLLLEYVVLDDRTLVWLVMRDHVSFQELRASREEIEAWSEEVKRRARFKDEEGFLEALQAPSRALLAPLARFNEYKRLVIVPDGAMHALPFSAMLHPSTERHLMQELAPLEIAGSATLYVTSLALDAEMPAVARPSVLAIGDPAFNEKAESARGMLRLPAAKREAERIFELYGAGRKLVDGQATVPALLAGAQSCEVVHVAGHGIANPDAPYQSYLLLAPSKGDAGVLTAEEMLSGLQPDRTRLFVLSACSSAGGTDIGPEGLAPLVRPLIAAGVPAVVGSLWDVQDEPTEDLLVEFHKQYRRGHDAAVALREAQRKAHEDDGVLAWAPFQLIGHASSFSSPKSKNAGR